MNVVVDLTGEWTLHGRQASLPREGRLAQPALPELGTSGCPEGQLDAFPSVTDQRHGAEASGADALHLTARVPGQVHLDLLREGLIPDPFWREQADDCQWVEKWDWTYERGVHAAD
jgi:hypothetical protein